jgi:hypothetical protein
MKTAIGIGIGLHAVQGMVKILGYVKVCAHWLSCLLKRAKNVNEEKFTQFTEGYPVEVCEFIHRIMTGDEIWIHQTDPERNDGACSGMIQYRPGEEE